MDNCPKCGYDLEKDYCKCHFLTIFDIYPTDYPQGADRCRRCGKVIDKIKSEYILNNPLSL